MCAGENCGFRSNAMAAARRLFFQKHPKANNSYWMRNEVWSGLWFYEILRVPNGEQRNETNLSISQLASDFVRSTLAWQGRCIFCNFVYYLQPTGRAKIFSIHQARGKLCESKWSETNEANEATQTLRVSFCHSFCLRPVLEHDMWRLRVVTSSKNHPTSDCPRPSPRLLRLERSHWLAPAPGDVWHRVTSSHLRTSADTNDNMIL